MGTGRYNVLLVEDDQSAIDLARRAVVECCSKIDLTVVGSGDAALEWLKGSVAKHGQMPHIILMDLKLPKLDGLAVMRTLRMHAGTRDIPIVAFSAEHTQADVLMGYQAGANCFVPKPADLEQFREIFSERLAYWIQVHQSETISATGGGTAERI